MTRDEPSPLWPPEAAAHFLGLEVKTLANWRAKSKGPVFLRVGGYVRYRREDVVEWADKQSSQVPA